MLEENQPIMYYCALTPKNLLYYRKFCAITVSSDLISVWPISFFTNSTTYNYPYIARTRTIFIARTIARFKVKLSTFKKIVFISFNESPLKMMENALRLFQNDFTRLRGEGVSKISDKKWQRGAGGYMQIVTSLPKNIMYKFLFFTWFCSARRQLSFGYHSGGGCRFKHWPEPARAN